MLCRHAGARQADSQTQARMHAGEHAGTDTRTTGGPTSALQVPTHQGLQVAYRGIPMPAPIVTIKALLLVGRSGRYVGGDGYVVGMCDRYVMGGAGWLGLIGRLGADRC